MKKHLNFQPATPTLGLQFPNPLFEKLSAAKQTALSQELPSWKHQAVVDLDKKNKLESRKQNESDPTEREFL